MTGISKDELQRVTLETLGRGAAVELFNHQLERAIADALDVNADPKASRTVQLTVKLVPTEDRSAAHIEAKVSTKLAGPSPVGSMVFIGTENGEAVAYDRIQTAMFPADAPAVHPITSRSAS